MELLRTACVIEDQRGLWSVRVPDIVVDTGTALTWIRREHLTEIGIAPEKRDRRFAHASGQLITRPIGFAVIRVGEEFTTDEVVFAEPDDPQLLGARTLLGLNVRVDSSCKELVAAGPSLAAGNLQGTKDP